MIPARAANRIDDFEPLLALANSRHGAGAHAWPSRLSADQPHDHLTTPAEVRGYFADEQLVVPRSPLTERDLRTLRQIRAATLALLERGQAGSARVGPLLARARYRLDARGSLRPVGRGWPAFAASLLPLLVDLRRVRGRLKVCRNPDCGWLFIDRTKNQSRVWCEMASCGNRAKVNRYLARHAAHPRGTARASRRRASAAAPAGSPRPTSPSAR